MTPKNQATVSYKKTTTISSPIGKLTRQQETKIVGDPSSPETYALMEKVSDKESKVDDNLLAAAAVLALGACAGYGTYKLFNSSSDKKRDEQVINPNPEMVEEIKQRSNKGMTERTLAFMDGKYTEEEKQRARMELDEVADILSAQIREFKQKYGDL